MKDRDKLLVDLMDKASPQCPITWTKSEVFLVKYEEKGHCVLTTLFKLRTDCSMN